MTEHPKFLEKGTETKQRQYNGRKILVHKGKVKIKHIQGWVDNPRIELTKKKFLSTTGDHELTQDEIFDLMKGEPDIKLKELRDNIINNGLREPLTLSFDGKLLDGNRRFFALRYALEGLPVSDPNRKDLELVNVFVLAEDATESDEHDVLVEENFSPSLKIEWPDYIKAQKIIEERESGLDIRDIAKKFKWSKSKINEVLSIHEITTEFIIYATTPSVVDDDYSGGLGLTEQDAEMIAAKNYQFFNEAKKSFFDKLKSDFDFKIQFFKWIYEKKFSSFQEVRIAYKAWEDPEAKAVLFSKEPGAAKGAKAILDYNSRVVNNTGEAIGKINNFLTFLKNMSAEEIKLIPKESREKLKEVIELITKMNKAASE